MILPSVNSRKATGSAKAFVLLSVSWIVLILAMLLLSQVRCVERRFESQRFSETDFRLRMAARSALNQILARMRMDVQEDVEKAAGAQSDEQDAAAAGRFDAPSDSWGWEAVRKAFAADLEMAYPGVHLSVAIEDEGGKLGLRESEPTRIAGVLVSLGWTPLQADELAQTMLGLTEDALQSQPGKQAAPEAGETAAQDSEGGASGESDYLRFPGLRHLLGVPGVTIESLSGEDINFSGQLDENENDGTTSLPDDDRDGVLRTGLTRYLTFLETDGKVNPNLAPKEILQTVPGISERTAEEIVERRTGSDGIAGTEDDLVFEKPEDLQELRSISRFLEFEYKKILPHLRLTTECFTIRICATNQNTGQVHRIQTCVKRSDKGDIWPLAWLEDAGL